jgi:hypothetical protein
MKGNTQFYYYDYHMHEFLLSYVDLITWFPFFCSFILKNMV